MNFPFLDGGFLRSTSYGVYICQLIRFARVCSHVDDLNTRNKVLTEKLLKQGFRWLVGCFGFNGPLRQYFSLYRAVTRI